FFSADHPVFQNLSIPGRSIVFPSLIVPPIASHSILFGCPEICCSSFRTVAKTGPGRSGKSCGALLPGIFKATM
ncbi:MAG: hypothetical protein KDK25_14955, partial [Leptospiraceae bacterium]|nr:hypothetical protein [Leptospiraceae bacterium]